MTGSRNHQRTLERRRSLYVCLINAESDLDGLQESSWRDAGVTQLKAFPAGAIASLLLSPERPDLVLIHGDDARTASLIPQILSAWPQTTVAISSTVPSVRGAVAGIRSGAIDYQPAPLSDEAVRNLVRAAETALERRTLAGNRTPDRVEPNELIGGSTAIRRLLGEIDSIAPHDATVLIQGEIGTGKEKVARLIHQRSPRATAPLVVYNCSSIVQGLVESELFGYEKGAFTGARSARVGAFEAAQSGTLLFDQIQELPLSIQPKLLRVLENRAFARIGSSRTIAADVRVIAAASRDLGEEVRAGRFRKDLYYRLNVAMLEIPPLRERGEDIPLLTEHFLHQLSKRFGRPTPIISSDAMAHLMSHSWDGNVRELRNVIERALISSRGRVITIRELGREFFPPANDAPRAALGSQELISLAELERNQIRRVLAMVGGDRARAVKALGLSRATFYRRLSELNLGSSITEPVGAEP